MYRVNFLDLSIQAVTQESLTQITDYLTAEGVLFTITEDPVYALYHRRSHPTEDWSDITLPDPAYPGKMTIS